MRVLGPGRGLPIAGLAGGFVSGAATTAAMARHATAPGLRWSALAGALMASVATLIQLVAITAIADTRVALLLVPGSLAGALVLTVEAVLLARRGREHAPGGGEEPAAPEGRPFALVPALILAAVLAVLLVVASWAQDVFGSKGTIAAISAAGLADAHAGALTAATMSAGQALTPRTAAVAALSAVGVNAVVKLVLAFTGGGRKVAVSFAGLIVAPIVAVTVGTAIALSLSA